MAQAASPSLQKRIIGAKIRYYREDEKGWTLQELADELNRLQDDKTWTRAAIYDKESGRSSLPSEHLSFFALALGVTEADLRDPRIPETDLTERLTNGSGHPPGTDMSTGGSTPVTLRKPNRHARRGDRLVPPTPAESPFAHAA